MTSRERIVAALRHEEPDRTPIFEYVLMSPVADALLGRPFAVDPGHWPECLDRFGWEAAVRQRAIDQLDLACLLGHDMMYVCPNPMPEQGDTPPQTRSTDPGSNPVAAVSARNEHVRAALAPPPDGCVLVYSFLKEEMARRGVDLPILAPAYFHGIWTDVDLMQVMLMAPEVAHEHFEIMTRTAFAWIDKYIDLGVDQIGVGGDFAGSRPLISPEHYREFIMPQVRACSRHIHDADRTAINASDGDLRLVIEDFLLGCEVDGYIEIDLFAGMDLARLKGLYGNRVTLYGNLDCGNMLTFGSHEDIRRNTIQCIEAGEGRGGHILCASNAITASISVESYLCVVQAYREFFGLPAFSLR